MNNIIQKLGGILCCLTFIIAGVVCLTVNWQNTHTATEVTHATIVDCEIKYSRAVNRGPWKRATYRPTYGFKDNKNQSHKVRPSFSSTINPRSRRNTFVELHYDINNPDKHWYTKWTQLNVYMFSSVFIGLGSFVLWMLLFAKPMSKEEEPAYLNRLRKIGENFIKEG